jgi:deoxyribodipyrimidine photo-lyase
MISKPSVSIFWFRRDLRLHDNKGLYHALKSKEPVLPLFIFDDDILEKLPINDHRVEFIFKSLERLDGDLRRAGSGLLVMKGKPFGIFSDLLNAYQIDSVFCNGDHEPYGMGRDERVKALLDANGVSLHGFTDHLVFDRNQVMKPDGSPYLVYTPYSRKWRMEWNAVRKRLFPSEDYLSGLFRGKIQALPSMASLGLKPSGMQMPDFGIREDVIRNYHETRNFPAMDGTSRLGAQLRFGTISIRDLAGKASKWNETFLNELIWREFYATILWHFPRVTDRAFKPEYDRIPWVSNEEGFEKWKAGKTGFPLVDAGMRQLSRTGYMHNRLRMLTASFLTKHLMIDWRWGEAWFAEKLFDFELSSNNGGWQWSAGTGCDAAPYFRVFNPSEQLRKFDPDRRFVKQWVPEADDPDYPSPMVDHKYARERWLKTVKELVTSQR